MIGSIFVAKELASTYQPLLLAEFTFSDGTIYRASTHPLSAQWGGFPYGGYDWDPRIQNQDLGDQQAMSDLGVDIVPQVTIILADADKTLFFARESISGFKGAILRLYSVMWDAGNATTASFSSNTPAPIKFVGTCGSAQMDQGSLTVTATSLLNFTQKQMPPLRIQQICSWTFPPDQSARSAALTNPFSIFYQCGYSYGIPGGAGNPETGTAAFTRCPLDFNSCIDRLGNPAAGVPILQDITGTHTGRFGGYQWIPPVSGGRQRPYVTGKWEDIVNASTDAKYGDYMPLCYGTTWVNPLVMGISGDGNYTNMEVAICFGKINRIKKVLVNGIEVQQLAADISDRPSFYIPSDSVTGDFKNGSWTTVNNGGRDGTPYSGPGWNSKGDPYGSVAAIAISALRQVAQENSVPNVAILVEGQQVPVYTDINTRTFQYSSNPAWILYDVLIKSGWQENDIDIQSFIDVSGLCNVIVNFDSMTGSYQNFYNESGNPDFNRFSVGFTVRQRMGFGDLVRGLRSAMRGILYFDFKTGKLKLGMKQTLADQQPAPIEGSNYNDPIVSVTHSGSVVSGYPAYSFDHTNVIKDFDGKSSLSVSQRSLQDSPNKTTIQFLNRENAYGTDSVTLVDIEDIRRVGQEVVASVPVIGCQTFDHARRIGNLFFAENYRGNPRLDYLGSAIGDTGGTLVFNFQTTVKALHLGVGDLCLLSDAQMAIIQQLVRIIRIKPSRNWETAEVTAVWHNDNWYQDTFGQSEQPIYGPAQGLEYRAPYSWRPGYAAPIDGDAYYGPTELSFDVNPRYFLGADNQGLANLQVTGKIAVNSFARDLSKPHLEILGEGEFGGGYPTSATLFGALAEVEPDNTAALSATSPPAAVSLTGAEDALAVVVQAWPGNPSGFIAFAGMHPLAMSFQFEGSGTPQVVDFTNDYKVASWGPPDDVFNHFQWKIREIKHGGIWGEAIPYLYVGNLVTATSIKISTFTNYGFSPDEFANREVSVYSLAPRNDGDTSTPIPIANFHVSGNDEDTLFIDSGDPTTCVGGGPLQSGDVMVMRMLPTYGEDARGKYFEDLLLINELNPVFENRMIANVTNTTPIVVTLDLTDGSDFPFTNGDWVVAGQVQGNNNANGGFFIDNCNPAAGTLELVGSTGNGDYDSGGIIGVQDRGLAPEEEAGNLAFIISGTGKGTFTELDGNTQTRVYIKGDWVIDPDSTTRLIIVSPEYLVNLQSPPINNSVREFVATLEVELKNYDRISLLIQPATTSRAGRQSLNTLDPFREMFMIGNPLLAPSDIPGGAPFTVRAEGYAMLTVNDLHILDSAYAVKQVNFLVPSIDETDIKLWITGAADLTTDPVTIIPDTVSLNSRFGTEIKVNDFVMWADNYEINQVIAKDIGLGTYTLKRHDEMGPPLRAMFGSSMSIHTYARLYRVVPRLFSEPVHQNAFGTIDTPSGVAQKWEWAWPNKTVLAVVSQAIGELGTGPLKTVNCSRIRITPTEDVACPGLRTMSGSSYMNLMVVGDLTVGSTARIRIPIQSWSSIRCVYAHVKTAPVGAAIKVHVCCIQPDMTRVGLVDTLSIGDGAFISYATSNLPRDRQMPYYAFGKGAGLNPWPPQELALCHDGTGRGILRDGILQLPLVTADVSPDNPYYEPDCFLDCLVETVGSTTPGADLAIIIQQ